GTKFLRTLFTIPKRLYAEAVGPNIIQDKKTTQEQFFRWLLFEKQQRAPEMAAKRLAEFSNNRLRQGEYIYRNLKTLFLNNGRYADASWAYVRERRTRRKMHAPTVASHYFRTSYPAEGRLRHIRRVWFYAKHLFLWLVDWLAELSCGYGERPLNTIILAFASLIIFPFIYATTGGIDGATTCLDYFNYSLATFTTIGFSQFTAITPLSQTLTSLEALLGIALLALLMFVLGNRISKA
ncbi:MAG: ion channel, partial [Chloroflexota bacterium]